MDETRAVINRFIATLGRQSFQLVSGLNDAEIAQVLNPHNNLDTVIVNKIIKAVEMIVSITDRSRRVGAKSRIKLVPNAKLIAEVKQIIASTNLAIADLAYIVSVSQAQLQMWLRGNENKFGWARLEDKLRHKLPTLRMTTTPLRAPNHAPIAVNVREFVDGYLLAAGSTVPAAGPCANN